MAVWPIFAATKTGWAPEMEVFGESRSENLQARPEGKRKTAPTTVIYRAYFCLPPVSCSAPVGDCLGVFLLLWNKGLPHTTRHHCTELLQALL